MYLAGVGSHLQVQTIVRDCIISNSNYYRPISASGLNIPFIPVSIGTAPQTGLAPIATGVNAHFATYTYTTLGTTKVYDKIDTAAETMIPSASTYSTSNINFILTRNPANQAFTSINVRKKLADNESKWTISRDMFGGNTINKTRNNRKLFKKTRKNS